MLHGLNGAGTATHGHALTAGEVVSIAGQFCGRVRRITTVEQPAQILHRGTQSRQLAYAEELIVS